LNIEVDHSTLHALFQNGVTPPDDDQTLLRTIYFGEALRAVQTYVSDSLLSGASEPMIDLLGEAFERLLRSRSGFTPEEFTTYYMSMLLDLCEDAEEASRLRLGAMRYLLASEPALPTEFSSVIEDARRWLLAESGKDTEDVDLTRASSHRLAFLVAQAQFRHVHRKSLESPLAELACSAPQDAQVPLKVTGSQRPREHQVASPVSPRRRDGPPRKAPRAAPRAAGVLATLGVVALLLYVSLVAIGAIKPVSEADLTIIEPEMGAW